MPEDQNHEAPADGFQPGVKLREKLKKFEDRRIDLSSIKFLNDSREFSGASATVSRAFLVSPSGGQDRTGQFDLTNNKCLALQSPSGDASRQQKVGRNKSLWVVGRDGERLINPCLIGYRSQENEDLTLREAEFLVGLSHENVIKLEGLVEELSKNILWLVFPWEENGTLKDFIASVDWEIPERIWLINDVAGGLEYLHSRQPPIRHGDLKSINILVNSQCRAVITDFGSARRLAAEELDKQTGQDGNKPGPQAAVSLEAALCASTNDITITLSGDHYTIRWAAPELLRGDEAGIQSDIWALGWVAYEVMTNAIPFQDIRANFVVITRVIRGMLPSITSDARMSLIRVLCSLMVACWSMEPQKRPSAEECQKSIIWMPMIRPNPIRTADAAASRARSPALLMKLGVMYRRQGDYPNASDLFTNALSRYGDVSDSEGKAVALVELAQLHLLRNEYNQAFASYSEALQIRTDIGDIPGRAEALWGLAEVHRLRDEYSQAITFYSEALQIRTDIGDRRGRADALLGLASVHQARDESNMAITFYSEVLQIRTDIGDKQGRANALFGLAEGHRAQRQYSQAVTLYSEALQIRTDIGDRRGRAFALQGLADVHRVQNEHTQAVTFYSEALQICTEIGDQYGRAYALRSLGHMHRLQKEDIQATTLYSEALEIFTDIGDQSGRAFSLLDLAGVHRDRGDYQDAIRLYTEAADLLEQFGKGQMAAYVSHQISEVRGLSNRVEAAW